MDGLSDVIVVGAGAAGCTAALVAAHAGLSVTIFEKTEYIGGSTAVSGGAIWIWERASKRLTLPMTAPAY